MCVCVSSLVWHAHAYVRDRQDLHEETSNRTYSCLSLARAFCAILLPPSLPPSVPPSLDYLFPQAVLLSSSRVLKLISAWPCALGPGMFAAFLLPLDALSLAILPLRALAQRGFSLPLRHNFPSTVNAPSGKYYDGSGGDGYMCACMSGAVARSPARRWSQHCGQHIGPRTDQC